MGIGEQGFEAAATEEEMAIAKALGAVIKRRADLGVEFCTEAGPARDDSEFGEDIPGTWCTGFDGSLDLILLARTAIATIKPPARRAAGE